MDTASIALRPLFLAGLALGVLTPLGVAAPTFAQAAKRLPGLAGRPTGLPIARQASAAPRDLAGTAWKIDFGRGVTGTVFLFCKSGRWEIVPARAGSIGAVGRSYKTAGSVLTTVNADDGKVEKWKMTWAGDVLIIDDGAQPLRLNYNGRTQC
jgi:hypothetical protein